MMNSKNVTERTIAVLVIVFALSFVIANAVVKTEAKISNLMAISQHYPKKKHRAPEKVNPA
jgi:hypothetical protein